MKYLYLILLVFACGASAGKKDEPPGQTPDQGASEIEEAITELQEEVAAQEQAQKDFMREILERLQEMQESIDVLTTEPEPCQ